jgi:hypothetical protein
VWMKSLVLRSECVDTQCRRSIGWLAGRWAKTAPPEFCTSQIPHLYSAWRASLEGSLGPA